jgi:hypothetical protein
MKRSIVFAAVVMMVAMFTAVPATAKAKSASTTSSTVSVTLRISVGEPHASQQYKSCGVSVTTGANGVAVLLAAKNAGCISGYTVTPSTYGNYVSCIDNICETPATYWRMTENGSLTSYGVDGFVAAAGDVLGFSHAEWVTCVFMGAC